MKKITFLLVCLFLGVLSFGQTTVTIGTGILSATSANGSPVYRSGATSAFNFSQSVELLTPADLSAVGITAGSTITKIAYKKLNAFTLSAGRTATMRIYMKNSSTTALGTTTNFATYTTGSTLCYNNVAYSNADLPAVAGWVEFNFGTPFNYTGGSIEVGIDWAINAGTGDPTNGAFAWEYTTVAANQAAGTSNSVAITGNLTTANTRIYNTQLTYTNSPCTGIPAPGNTVVSTSGCFGSSATLSLQNPTIGSGVTYQWFMNAIAIPGATNANYVISNLSTSDTYYCQVTCAGNTTASNSLLVGPSILNAPLLEPFAVFLPSCWTNMFGGDLTTGPTTSTGSGWVADGFANSGTTGAIRNEIWTTGANDWVISPVINIPAVGYELKFDAAATQFGSVNAPTNAWESDDFIEVLVSTTGLTNWTPVFTYNNANQPSNTGSPNIIDLDAYAGQNIRIAYRAVEGATNGTADIDFSIDNFQVRLTPTCIEPINLVSSGVTSSTVNISWDATTPVPTTGYEYFVSTSNTVPVTAGTATTNTFAIPSGLLPQTTYYVFVRSDCSTGDFSSWTGPISFTTLCAPLAVPVLENFATFLPSVCWFNRTGGDLTTGPTTLTGSGWVADGFANAGTTGAVRNEIWTTGANDWFISPEITIPATGYELKFDAAATQFASVNAPTNAWESDDFIEVLVSTTGLTNWTPIFTYNDVNQPSNTGTPNIIDLDAYAGQNIRIAFRAVEGATNGTADIDFSLDNFQVRLTPTCIEPLNLVSSGVTSSTVNISWDATTPSPTTGYEYFVSTSNTVPVTAGTATTNTFAIPSGLLPQTTYYVFVRSDCSAGDFSSWTGPISFTTTCAPIAAPVLENFATFLPSVCWFNRTGGDLTTGPTTLTGSGWVADGFANAGTTGAVRNEIWTTGANDWFISPEITIPATGYELKFDAAATQFASVNAPTNAWESDDFIEVLVSTTGLTNWTPVFIYNDVNQPSNTGSPNIIDLDAYSGQNIRIAFRAVEGGTNGTADIDFSIDNFQIRLTPTCVEPLNLVSSSVTATTANISWDATTPSPTTGYEYFVSTTNTVPVTAGTATTNTFAALSTLLPQTTYYIFVRSDCSTGDFSAWTGPISFTTACAPIATLPWIQNFDSVTVPAIPTCWFEENGDYVTAIAGTYNTPYSGANYLRDSWSATNEYMWTPGFDLVAGTSYDFSSWIQGDGFTGWTVDYFVNSTQNSTGATQLGGQYAVPGTGTIALQPYSQVTRSFVPSTSGTYYFAFRVNQPSTTPWYVAFDNVEVKLSPACPSPSPSASNITNVSADLSWAVVPSAALGYEYVLDNVATDPAGAGTSTLTTTYSASGLTQVTTYYFHIRSVCSAGTFSPWSTVSFTTLPTPPVNDNLCNATALTVGTPTGITNTLVGATGQASEPAGTCFDSGINGSVWFSFVAPTSGSVDVTTDFAGGSLLDGDTEIAVYAANGVTCSNLTTLGAALGCDQDGGTTVNFSSFLSLTGLIAGDTYYVQVDRWGTATAGTFGIQVSAVLSSESFDKSTFVAYPNPVKDVLNISYKTAISNVKVINLLGQEVLNVKSDTNDVQVNMSALNAGAYIVAITVEDTVHTIKVIKE